MDIVDLCIGNWVYESDPSGFPMQIVDVYEDEVCLDFEGNEADVWECKPNEIQPIPLTDDYLDKIGIKYKKLSNDKFKVTAINGKNIGRRHIELLRVLNKPHTFLVEFGTMTHLSYLKARYVHELQNILNIVNKCQ